MYGKPTNFETDCLRERDKRNIPIQAEIVKPSLFTRMKPFLKRVLIGTTEVVLALFILWFVAVLVITFVNGI